MRKAKEVTNPFSPEQLQAAAQRAEADIPWDPNESNDAAEETPVMVQPADHNSRAIDVPTTEDADYKWLEALRAPLPASLIKYRTESWGEVAYIEWHTVADILDQELGGKWNFTIKNVEISDVAVVCTAELSVTNSDWSSTYRTGLGVAPIRVHGGVPNIELAVKSAASDALKRAAVLFGVGRDLYTGETDMPEDHRPAQPASARTTGYQRPTSGGFQMRAPNAPATEKQIGMCKALANRLGIDVYAEAEAVIGIHLDNATKSEISTFIEHLMAMSNNG